jgi:prepilin-type N-terminal cleavage/methylation domain-containing protein/prepilin-type processing-associated H-X9-DG protein
MSINRGNVARRQFGSTFLQTGDSMQQTFSRRGFSLIELLVVMAIVSLLVGMLLPSLQTVRETIRVAKCMNNMRQIGIALQTYSADYQGRFPSIGYGNLSGITGIWENYLTANYLGRVTDLYNNGQTVMLGDMRQNGVWWCPDARRLVNKGGQYVEPQNKNELLTLNSFARHYGFNSYANDSRWRLDLYGVRPVPQPASTILLAEHNNNSSGMAPNAVVERTGKLNTNHRVSHRRGAGANYLFCDGHVEYIKGDQGTGGYMVSSITNQKKMWRWW